MTPKNVKIQEELHTLPDEELLRILRGCSEIKYREECEGATCERYCEYIDDELTRRFEILSNKVHELEEENRRLKNDKSSDRYSG